MPDDTSPPSQEPSNGPLQGPSRVRRLGRRAGQALTVVAVVFLAWELQRQWGKINDWRPTAAQAGLLVAFALCYASALFGLAWNWLTILTTVVGRPLTARPVLLSYTQTQIAKYVPGNVLHLVSRHIYLKALGLPHRPIALSTVFELVGLPVAALGAVCLLLPFAEVTNAALWDPRFTWLPPVGVALCLTVGAGVLIWQGRRPLMRPIAVVLARTTGFMLVQGLIFALVLRMISGAFVFDAIPIAILAWLIGFVTPGAPGGVAIREALLVKMLAIAALQPDVLIAALLFRLVTTAGDLVLYAVGRAFVGPAPAPPGPDRI